MARKRFRNFTVAAILFMSLVAIVITGFGTGGFGGLSSLGRGGSSPTGNELARVGSQAITTDQFNTQFNQDFQNLQRNLPNLQISEFVNQGGFEGSLDRLIALEALRQYAQARGIVITRQMIDDAISTSPEFQFARIGGTFDNGIFQRALQAARVPLELVREEYGRQLLRQQLLQPIQAGFVAPLGVGQAYATVPMEQRTGMIGVVPVGAIERGLNPSEAEIARYYQQYRDYFSVPERRVIKYAMIGPEQVTIAAPTEAEIRTVYDNTPRYQAGQIRTLLSVVFPSGAGGQAEANAFAQRVRGGTAFMQAATAAGRTESDVRAANMTQSAFANRTSAQVAEQVFRAGQGAIVGPIQSPLGWHVVRVETTSGGQPLEAVRADIVRELERRKRAVAITALVTQLEDQIDDGKSFEDAANGAHLRIVTSPAITAQGRLSNGRPWADLSPDLRALLPAAFDMTTDSSETQMVTIRDNASYALLGIDRTEAAAPPPLAEIHDLVRSQLIRRTAVVQSYRIANAIAARINSGVPIAQAFAQAGLPLPPPQTITAHRQDIMVRQAPAALRLFFRLRPGTAGVIEAPNGGGYMIAAPQQSLRAATATPQEGEAVRMQLNTAQPPDASGRRGSSVAVAEAEWQLVRAMEQRIGVQRNLAAIRAERQRLSAGAAPQ